MWNPVLYVKKNVWGEESRQEFSAEEVCKSLQVPIPVITVSDCCQKSYIILYGQPKLGLQFQPN